MIKKSGIYKITNTINGKIYIGQSSWLQKRFIAHKNALRKGVHPNIYLQRAYNKYGEESFDFSVIEYCSPEQLNELEQQYIKKYNTFHDGYNLTLGGEGTFGYKISDAGRENMRKNHADVSGERNPMYGKSWKEYCTSEEIREHNLKIRMQLINNNSNVKNIICLNNDVIYRSAIVASQELNINANSIRNCCRNITSHCGYDNNGNPVVFLYKDDYDKMLPYELQCRIEYIEQCKRFGMDNSTSKKIVLLNTKEVFESLNSAAEQYKISASGISFCINKKHSYCGSSITGEKYVWVLYDEYIQMSEEDIINIIMKAQNVRKKVASIGYKKVYCVTTDKVFESITDAGRYYHIDPSSIVKNCKGKTKYAGKHNGEKMYWKYIIE